MLERFKNVPISTLVCFVIVVLMMIFVLFTSGGNHKKREIIVNKEDIVERFNKINNNYQLNITRTINGSNDSYTYYTDGKLELYETDSLDIGYLVYNNKTYSLNSNDMKLYEISEKPNYIDDLYGNILIIKNLINKCDFEHISSSKVNCKIQESDYINEINNYYNKNYYNNGSKILNIEIQYGTKINELDIDYSSINQLVKNTNEQIKYKIKISNIGSNNFDNIFEHYQNQLK